MSIIISPNNSKLGISRFWASNFLPTVNSNYTKLDKYKYQDYIYTLENFMNTFFLNRTFERLAKKSIYYHGLKLNCFGFPDSYTLQNFVLTIDFYDLSLMNFSNKNQKKDSFPKNLYSIVKSLNIILKSYEESRVKMQYSFIKNTNSKKKNISDLNDLTSGFFRTHRQLSDFIMIISRIIQCKKYLKVSFIKRLNYIKSFFKKYFFFERLLKLHSFYFGDKKIFVKIKVHPCSIYISAFFIGLFIERRVKKGMLIMSAINLVFRILQKSKSIIGLRIVCAGRIFRGLKAGYKKRLKGTFTFGKFNTLASGYSMDYAEKLIQTAKGLCGLRIWVSHYTKDSLRSRIPSYRQVNNFSGDKKTFFLSSIE